MGKNNTRLPNESQNAGTGFIIAGIVLGVLGGFVLVVEMFNDADFGPMLIGGLLLTFCFLSIITGYVKQAAVAATESYQLQKRIYAESISVSKDAPQA